MRTAVVLLVVWMLAGPSRAEVPGGGLVDADCRVVFAGIDATDGPSTVVCVDGDPACDADGTADGTCRFAVRLCTGTPTDVCSTSPLSSLDVAGLPLIPPPVPAPDGTCGDPLALGVATGEGASATLLARGAGQLRDVDYLDVCCVAAPDPLAAARCALAIDLAASGCDPRRIPGRARTAFARAGRFFQRFAADPGSEKMRRKALARLDAMRSAAKRLVAKDACGNALGLIATETAELVRAATPAGGS